MRRHNAARVLAVGYAQDMTSFCMLKNLPARGEMCNDQQYDSAAEPGACHTMNKD